MKTFSRNISIFALATLITTAWSAKGDVQITIGATTYDVTEVSTVFDADAAQLTSQPEWGNPTLSYDIATAVGSQLPGGAFLGPGFAYADDGGSVSFDAYDYEFNIVLTDEQAPDSGFGDLYGVLTAVSVPEGASQITDLFLALPFVGLALRNLLRQQRME